ncbi:OTU domain-containing protein [Legionella worsleiensis]|uniref:Uncharacterized protein n=1 Tax=Legionella worsleiensis TaxID=45076 RepID=A0A0W1AKB8_9GAMM|nr:OTU domain-containing protein [Legionella worsleiensis]KTD81777.1 hypothetical protein Lwor_0080 [Legionella worsleiensis]STY31142.1 Uncharacterised protein [Legionella worsleiensis]
MPNAKNKSQKITLIDDTSTFWLVSHKGIKIYAENEKVAGTVLNTLKKAEWNHWHSPLCENIILMAKESVKSGQVKIIAFDTERLQRGALGRFIYGPNVIDEIHLAATRTSGMRPLRGTIIHELTHHVLPLANRKQSTFGIEVFDHQEKIRRSLCTNFQDYMKRRAIGALSIEERTVASYIFKYPRRYLGVKVMHREHITHTMSALTISEKACWSIAPDYLIALNDYIEFEMNRKKIVPVSKMATQSTHLSEFELFVPPRDLAVPAKQPIHSPGCAMTRKKLISNGLKLGGLGLLTLYGYYQSYIQAYEHYNYLESQSPILHTTIATSASLGEFAAMCSYWSFISLCAGPYLTTLGLIGSIEDSVSADSVAAHQAAVHEYRERIGKVLSAEEVSQNLALYGSLFATGDDESLQRPLPRFLDEGSITPIEISLLKTVGSVINLGQQFITDTIYAMHDSALSAIGHPRPADPAKTLQASLSLQQAYHELQLRSSPSKKFKGDIISNTLQQPSQVDFTTQVQNTPAASSSNKSLSDITGFVSSDDERFHFAPPKHWIKEYQIDPLNVANTLRPQTPLPPKLDLSFHFSPDGFQVGVTTSFGYNLPRGNFKPDSNQTPETQSWFNGNKTFSDLFGAVAVPVIEHFMDWDEKRYQEREAHAVKKQGKIITRDCEEKFFGKYNRICELYNAYTEESDKNKQDALLVTLRVETNNFFPEAQNFLFQYQSYKPDTKKYQIGGHRVRYPVYNFIQNNLLPVIRSVVEEKLPQLDRSITALEAEANNFKLEEGITNAYGRYLNKEIFLDDLIKLRISNVELIINNLMVIKEALHGRDRFKVNLLIERNKYQILSLQTDIKMQQAAHDTIAGTMQLTDFNNLFEEQDAVLRNRIIFLEKINKKKGVHTDERNANNAEIAKINDQRGHNRDCKFFIQNYYLKSTCSSRFYEAFNGYLSGTMTKEVYDDLFLACQNSYLPLFSYFETQTQTQETIDQINELKSQWNNNEAHNAYIHNKDASNSYRSMYYKGCNDFLKEKIDDNKFEEKHIAYKNSLDPLSAYFEQQSQHQQEQIRKVIDKLKNINKNNVGKMIVSNSLIESEIEDIYKAYINGDLTEKEIKEKCVAYEQAFLLIPDIDKKQVSALFDILINKIETQFGINEQINTINEEKTFAVNHKIHINLQSEFNQACKIYVEGELEQKYHAYLDSFELLFSYDEKNIGEHKENKHQAFCKFIQTLITANAPNDYILSLIEQHQVYCTDERQLIISQHFRALVKKDINELVADFKSLKKLPLEEGLEHRITTLYRLTALLDEKQLAKKNLGLLSPEEQITTLWVEIFSDTSDLLDQIKSQLSKEESDEIPQLEQASDLIDQEKSQSSEELIKHYTLHSEQVARRIIEDLFYERNREFIRQGKNVSYCDLTVDVICDLFPDAIKQTLHLSDQQFANLHRVVSNSFAAISTYINHSMAKMLSDPIPAIIQKTGLPEPQALSLYNSYVAMTSGADAKPEGLEVAQGVFNKATPYVTVAKLATSIADFLLQLLYENDIKDLLDKPDFEKWLEHHFLANCAQSFSTMIGNAASAFSTAQELLSIALLLRQGPDKIDKLTYVRKLAGSLINMPYLHQMVHDLMRDRDGRISEHPLYVFYSLLINNMQSNAGQQLICKHQDTILDGITEIFARNTFFETLANTITLEQDSIRNVWFYTRSFVNACLALANYRSLQTDIISNNIKLDLEEIEDLIAQGDVSLINQKAIMLYSDLKDKLATLQNPDCLNSDLRQLYITVLFKQHLLDCFNPVQIESLPVEGDGLFESISVHCNIPVAGLRSKVALHIIKNKDYYEPLINGSFDAFISGLRNHARKDLFQEGEPPFKTVIHALSEVTGRPIIIAFNGTHPDLERQGLDAPGTIKLGDPIFLAYKQVGSTATFQYQVILLRGEAFAEAVYAKILATKSGLPQPVLSQRPKFFSTPTELKERVKRAQAAIVDEGGDPLILFMGKK